MPQTNPNQTKPEEEEGEAGVGEGGGVVDRGEMPGGGLARAG